MTRKRFLCLLVLLCFSGCLSKGPPRPQDIAVAIEFEDSKYLERKLNKSNIEESLTVSSLDSPTPLQYAAFLGSDRICALLIKLGASIEAIKGDDLGGTSMSALAAACVGGHLSTVRYLIDQGANINRQDSD